MCISNSRRFPFSLSTDCASEAILNNRKCFFNIVSGKSWVCDLDFNSAPNANTTTSLMGAFREEKMFLLLNGAVQVDESPVAVFCD